MDEKAKRYWNCAISMRKALIAIPPKDWVEEFQKLQKQSATPVYLASINKSVESGRSFSESVLEAQSVSEKFRVSQERLERYVLKYIKSGELIAAGFSLPRRASDSPEFIPDDVWGGYVDWDKGTIEANGLSVVEVRLTHPSWLLRSQMDSPPTRGRGRPSRKADVLTAFNALLELGKINLNGPMKANYGVVRAYVMQEFPNNDNDDTGLSDTYLAQEINHLIKQAAKIQNLYNTSDFIVLFLDSTRLQVRCVLQQNMEKCSAFTTPTKLERTP